MTGLGELGTEVEGVDAFSEQCGCRQSMFDEAGTGPEAAHFDLVDLYDNFHRLRARR